MIQDVLLLAAFVDNPETDPCLRPHFSSTLLEWQIRNLRASGRTPTVIIGPNGDLLLLKCRSLEDVDLIFDHSVEPTYWSSISLGMTAFSKAVYVMPVELPSPATVIWTELEHRIHKTEWRSKPLCLSAQLSSHAPRAPNALGFPLLINHQLVKLLNDAETDDIESLLHSHHAQDEDAQVAST